MGGIDKACVEACNEALVRPNDAAGSGPRGAMPRPGRVALVGAGPGDPDLLTVKAARLIGGADAVVHDHLVSAEVLALVGRHTIRICVGKRAGNHTLPQAEINELLVTLARRYPLVVRLKGGDPYVFGRGGEEALALAKRGVPFEVVPGITAAAGMAASSGIPLTHRDMAQSVTLLTAHLRDGSRGLDWCALARPRQTLVIYMGVAALAEIATELQAHGRAGDTPVALIENATTANQRVVTGALRDLALLGRQHAIRPPALVVIGEVVCLHAELAPALASAAQWPALPADHPSQGNLQS